MYPVALVDLMFCHWALHVAEPEVALVFHFVFFYHATQLTDEHGPALIDWPENTANVWQWQMYRFCVVPRQYSPDMVGPIVYTW